MNKTSIICINFHCVLFYSKHGTDENLRGFLFFIYYQSCLGQGYPNNIFNCSYIWVFHSEFIYRNFSICKFVIFKIAIVLKKIQHSINVSKYVYQYLMVFHENVLKSYHNIEATYYIDLFQHTCYLRKTKRVWALIV